MKTRTAFKLAIMASAAALVLTGCSDTDISSPGTPTTPTPPPPPPPPPPPAATIDLVPAAGCPTGTTEVNYAAVPADGFSDIDVCELTGTITSNITIPANTSIALQGPVFIGEDTKGGAGSAVTLTVGEGVRFFGASESGTGSAIDDYIVISRGSAIEAVGTEAAPIRFTARAAVNDEETGSSILTATTDAQWGGLVINGFAPINACQGAAVGGTADCEKSGEGSSGFFGGDAATDDSGELRYVIVEYAGARLTNNDELNGIAFQGVGSGTEVNYIQVHNNLDDGIEWFGGTVNVKYAAVTGAGDDSIDWTDGWTGSLQFAAVNSDRPTSGDPRGIEGDNLSGDFAATPVSNPKIANFTMVGSPNNQQGMLVRRGSAGTFINGIVTGFTPGFDVDNQETFDNYTSGDLVFESIALDNGQNFASDSDGVPAIPVSANVRGYTNSLTDGFFPGTAEGNFPTSTALSGDAFFSAADYVGAFGPTETAAANWANFTLANTLFDAVINEANCPTGTVENGTLDGKKLCQISSANPIVNDLTLSDGGQLIYELVGPVFIGEDLGSDPANPLATGDAAILTIEPGVTIVGEGNDDYLVITRGSEIRSNGTAAAPVVFTAKGAVDGTTTLDQDTKGLWGGVVINGRAPINACQGGATGGTVDCEKSGEGSSGLFGGATADDDSGHIYYTRVQYAGTRLTNTDELNGIAFQGTGSGLEVDHVQIYNNLDDCFEWFGGTTNATHLLAIGCGDDSLDWTDGWNGSIQYAIVYSGVASATGGISGDPRGIEGDNLSGNFAATPVTDAKVSNFTIISGGDTASDTGVVLRRGMGGVIANGIVLGWPDAGIDVDDAETVTNFNNGALEIQSIFLSGNGDDLENDGTDVTFTAANNMVTGQTVTTSGFTFRTGRPGVVPGANEQAVPVFDVTGEGALTATTYVGAVEDANDTWFLGWSIDQEGNLTSVN
ncbi:hypothetical protein RYZ27_08725 [Hyphomonas sp. FCG-A18]|jgi:hypothetical protein|uniref:hypothetical protein n=1 Tax=Hyphomonas sp. FCG-A18 TaxID=3080019 RepID=UPI002B2FD40A|nr:hypothetical protein RYZ27_08725 [Hyphomonas sp. FCG-A18]